MTKSLVNHLYLKLRLHSFKMEECTTIEDHLDEFNKIILDLENIDVTVEEEDQTIILLNLFDKSYINFVDTLMFSHETLSVEEVQSALNSKELMKQLENKNGSKGEGFTVRGGSKPKDTKNKKKSWSKSRKHKCFICHKEGTLRRIFRKERRKKTTSKLLRVRQI